MQFEKESILYEIKFLDAAQMRRAAKHNKNRKVRQYTAEKSAIAHHQ
jgi:hypothetical protein